MTKVSGGNRILDELKVKVKEGVDVRVVFERYGSINVSSPWI